jgi:hypothetical protein
MKYRAIAVISLAGIAAAAVFLDYFHGSNTPIQPIPVESAATPPPSPIVPQGQYAMGSLLQRLEEGELERRQLSARIEELSAQLTALTSSGKNVDIRSIDASSVAQPPPELEPLTEDLTEEYLDVGFDLYEAVELINRSAEISMERLYLRDRASRENWLDSDRFSDALRELESRSDKLRDELGDDGWDRYLYASGSANRVGINSIIEGSPAQLAGLQPGDTIRSYDETAVFSINEIQSATKGGQYGEQIRVEIDRNGATSIIYIPRGPLGVTLRTRRQRPE